MTWKRSILYRQIPSSSRIRERSEVHKTLRSKEELKARRRPIPEGIRGDHSHQTSHTSPRRVIKASDHTRKMLRITMIMFRLVKSNQCREVLKKEISLSIYR